MARAPAFLAALLLAAALPAAAQGRPDLGAGPHLDRSETRGGEGSRRQGDVAPKPPAVPVVPESEAGKASAGPSQAAPDADEQEKDKEQQQDDEREATRSKERMKKRPGYQEDVQPPRAHAQ